MSRAYRVAAAPALAGAVSLLAMIATAGCGQSRAKHRDDRAALAAARAASRPIGVGPRFVPPPPNGAVAGCRRSLGVRGAAHVELFANDRVVLIPAGVGTQGPRTVLAGRITRARCYGPVVTLEPTGTVLVAAGRRVILGDLFAVWGQRLDGHGFASFRGRVRAYVGGRRWRGVPATVPLTRHAVIVLEVGPFVPPHRSYVFPRGL